MDKFYPLTDAARMMGTTEYAVIQAIKRGEVPARLIGQYWVPKKAIDSWRRSAGSRQRNNTP